MEKIAIITDSTSDINNELIKKYNIKLLPFKIIYPDKEYRDRFEISPEEVYGNFKNTVPKSSIPSLEEMTKAFEDIVAEGYTHVIAITLSSGLSGIANAIEMTSENFPSLKTCVFDSKSISMGEGYLVETCCRLIDEQKSFDEIIAVLEQIRSTYKVFFIIGTLEYLIKGGRIGKVAGTVGELLNIKPIISINNDGVYYQYAKARGRKQSLNKMLEISKELLAESPKKIYVMSGYAEEECHWMVDKMKDFYNVKSIQYGGNISPVAGVHSGPGLVGIIFINA
ncbi:DegV family protein [Clostridium oryzae]|uniref:DegV domain-containing protein n=1 Tax=Clostridium oryzae TaxID=1450648 RepID=A0A1V4IBM6_9CLOT|nr:DegV family protein [Clostridium oryzae]OPJ57391.1 DegV domain-containing protein [Clostridium oryzae]